MKKLGLFLGLLCFLAVPSFAATHSVTVLLGPGHTAYPACAAGACDGTADSTSGIIDTSTLSSNAIVYVTAGCAIAPCTGTINVQQRSKVNSTTATKLSMTTLISCTNPDPTTGLCFDTGSQQMYVIVSGELQVQQVNTGTGTFNVVLEIVTP